jgi:hypothetical protein
VHRTVHPAVTSQAHDDEHRADVFRFAHDGRRRRAEHDPRGPRDRFTDCTGERGADRALLLAVQLRTADRVGEGECGVEGRRDRRPAGIHHRDDVHHAVVLRRERVGHARRGKRARRAVGGQQHGATGQIERATDQRRATGQRIRLADRRVRTFHHRRCHDPPPAK